MHKGILKGTLGGVVLGTYIMYWLDPATGGRRRALVRDQVVSLLTNAGHGARVAARDLAHRVAGLGARAYRVLRSSSAADEVIVARVRAALGRVVSHPGAVHVSASNGHVSLTGPILSSEHGRLMQAMRAVRGAKTVEDQLEVFKRADHVSALQGGRSRFEHAGIVGEDWPPALRLLATVGGTAAMLWGIRKGGIAGYMMAVGGGTVALRGVTNVPLGRIADRERRGIDIHKSLQVGAPLEQVFDTLIQCQNFPLFMRNVHRVSRDGGRSHWVVAGPAGVPIEWDAETTVIRPQEVLAWHTVSNATVAHAGIIRLQRRGTGTHLDIHMTYNPPAGVVGHMVAKLFGSDAKSELDEDLLRFKTFLETGVPARDAAAHHSKQEAPLRVARPSRDIPAFLVKVLPQELTSPPSRHSS
jgi:uncharacterized membrane protein